MLTRRQRQARADARICFALAMLAGTIAVLSILGVIALYPIALGASEPAIAADAGLIVALLSGLSLTCAVATPVMVAFGLAETRRF